MSALCINTSVILSDGYTGDWKQALEEAKALSVQLGVPVSLSYAGQYRWLITKDTDIEEIKKQRIIIGL